MKENKVISALSYWSVLFAPILFPVLAWIVGDSVTRSHAKRALWTHLIPSIAVIIAVMLFGLIGVSVRDIGVAWGIGAIIAFCVCGVISVYYFVWNIIKGIQVINS
ncbi:DUF4870 domain-containing protein [Paenibacillus alvei]|uniref:DUF4870 domain-containing protein n=1 Tax=Paenibacillus alvei TaxID=44250 RepID=A0ABT4E979_PAEAL|nr:DUF4870 domain-containing protein [Paenibacillus alvei]MCY9530295.1 DUF4870 domain-containing protein [Paenibacillus alvei]